MWSQNRKKVKRKLYYSSYIIDALKSYVDKSVLNTDFEKFSSDELEKIQTICCQNRVISIIGKVLSDNGQKCRLITNGVKANITNEFNFFVRLKEYKNVINDLKGIVDFALVKGVHIGNLVYKNPFDRPSSDLDILVKYEHISITEKLLLDLGYRQAYITTNGLKDYDRSTKLYYVLNTHSLAPFRKISNDVLYEIDVNFNSYLKDEKIIPASEFLKSRINKNFFGIDVPVLDETYAFLYLALHHYRESVSLYHIFCGQDFDFLKACDIYFFYTNVKVDNNILFDVIKKYDLYEDVYRIINDVNSVFNDNDLAILKSSLKTKIDYKDEINWPMKLPERLEADNRFDLIKNQLNNQEKSTLFKNIKFLK